MSALAIVEGALSAGRQRPYRLTVRASVRPAVWMAAGVRSTHKPDLKPETAAPLIDTIDLPAGARLTG